MANSRRTDAASASERLAAVKARLAERLAEGPPSTPVGDGVTNQSVDPVAWEAFTELTSEAA